MTARNCAFTPDADGNIPRRGKKFVRSAIGSIALARDCAICRGTKLAHSWVTTMSTGCVIAAIDLGPSTARVLYHAAAFAHLIQAPLKVLPVNGVSVSTRRCVLDACLRHGPYQTDFDDRQIVIRSGRVSDAIVREAAHDKASLVVVGSRGHGGVAKFLLGSTSDAVLRTATTAVLLVPPIDMDIVSIGDEVALTCGPLVAAVDLAEDSHEQLRLASKLAHLGSQPLLLMTVAKSRVSNHDASQGLRERARGLTPVKPASVIVRRGRVATEISRCASVEGAGLVVMGLRAGRRGRPGAIALAVLKTRRAFVLAVPSTRTEKVAAPTRTGRLAMIASLAAAIVVAHAPVSLAQSDVPDVRAIVDFQRATDAYAFLHRQVELRLRLAHRDAGVALDPIETSELAAAIVARRLPPVQPIFTPRVVAAFREMAARAARASGCDAGELRSGLWEMQHDVNTPATGTKPLSACISDALPALPVELEYRSAGTVLLLVDTHANLVVDLLPALLAGSDLRR